MFDDLFKQQHLKPILFDTDCDKQLVDKHPIMTVSVRSDWQLTVV